MKAVKLKTNLMLLFCFWLTATSNILAQRETFPGPGGTTIYDNGGEVIVWDEKNDPEADDATWVDCERHPEICEDLRERNPDNNPDEGGGGSTENPDEGEKKKKKKKTSSSFSTPPSVIFSKLTEIKKVSKTGMLTFKKGKWIEIQNFKSHIASLRVSPRS